MPRNGQALYKLIINESGQGEVDDRLSYCPLADSAAAMLRHIRSNVAATVGPQISSS